MVLNTKNFEGGFSSSFCFNYCELCDDYLDEIYVIGSCINATKRYQTPEQAIALTLGNERLSSLEEKAKQQGDYIYKLLKERDEVVGGKLTAEQVEKVIHDCSAYASYDGCTYYASGIRLQEITDKLNEMLVTSKI